MEKSSKFMLIFLLSAAIIFGTVVGISYLPRRIHQEFSGIELLLASEDDYEILQMTNILIYGRVRYGMFASFPIFAGSIEVSTYDFTLDNPNLGIHFVNGFSMGGSMSYPVLERSYSGSGHLTRIDTLGMLYTNEDFSSIVIHLFEWTYLGGGSRQGHPGNRFIVAPATDGSFALDVLRTKKY